MPRVSIENIKDINPLAGFQPVAEFYDAITDYDYFGYLNSEGQWYIVQEVWDAYPDSYVYYYAKGDSDFWTNFEICNTLTYRSYDEVW